MSETKETRMRHTRQSSNEQAMRSSWVVRVRIVGVNISEVDGIWSDVDLVNHERFRERQPSYGMIEIEELSVDAVNKQREAQVGTHISDLNCNIEPSPLQPGGLD